MSKFVINLNNEIETQLAEYCHEMSVPRATGAQMLVSQGLKNYAVNKSMMVQLPDIMKALASNPKIADSIRKEVNKPNL